VTESATSAPDSGTPFSGRTAWIRSMDTPLRTFLRTETGSASVLAGATAAALVWANVSDSSYDRFWATRLSVLVGGWGVTLDLREFVNSGLMALFFLVVGLEARREFDLGELRERRRLYQKEGREPRPAEIAARMGSFAGYQENRAPMIGVIAKHRAAVGNIEGAESVPADLLSACRRAACVPD